MLRASAVSSTTSATVIATASNPQFSVSRVDIDREGNTYTVDTLRDLNRQLDWDLPDQYAATVAGLVLHEARVIPDVNAVFEFFGYRFTIAEKRVNQITQLLVERLADSFDDAQE